MVTLVIGVDYIYIWLSVERLGGGKRFLVSVPIIKVLSLTTHGGAKLSCNIAR